MKLSNRRKRSKAIRIFALSILSLLLLLVPAPLRSADPALQDPDGDGLSNIIEARLGTDPTSKDTDGDGMDDFWENAAGLNPLVNDADQDPDHDGRTNLEEYHNDGWHYTNPLDPDTDHDGIIDGEEGPGLAPPLQGVRRLTPDLQPPPHLDQTLAEWLWDEDNQQWSLTLTGLEPGEEYNLTFDYDHGHVVVAPLTADADGALTYTTTSPGGTARTTVARADDPANPSATIFVKRLLYISNGLHGPVLATDQSGAVVWRRAYGPLGDRLGADPCDPEVITADTVAVAANPVSSPVTSDPSSPSAAVLDEPRPLTASSSPVDPVDFGLCTDVDMGFVTRQYDYDVGLYQLGARWYDPRLGRFISPDPVPSSLNQYAYAGNNPFSYQDANGLLRYWNNPMPARDFETAPGLPVIPAPLFCGDSRKSETNIELLERIVPG